MLRPDALNSIFDQEWCRRHCKPRPSVYNFLQNRELELRRPGTQYLKGGRDYYDFVRLERIKCDAVSTDSPIRFTPDGKQLVCFNMMRHEVHVYWYNGIQEVKNKVDSKLSDLFTEHFWIPMSRLDRAVSLARETCLITEDSKFMIIAYSVPLAEHNVMLVRLQHNNESELPRNGTEHVVFITVDLATGAVKYSLRFEYEARVYQNVYLVGRMFGILSTQHQTIHLYKIDSHGQLISVVQVGRTLYEDDRQVLDAVHRKAVSEKVMGGFRQRVMTHLFKVHQKVGQVQNFLRCFSYYRSLRMARFQFLSADVLLVRMDAPVQGSIGGDQELFAKRTARHEAAAFHYMFVLYNWRSTQVLAVLNRTSQVLFNTLTEAAEFFKNGHTERNPFPNTMQHCQHLRVKHAQVMESWMYANHPCEVRKKFLNTLPFSYRTCYLQSPLLDPHVYSYDERLNMIVEKCRLPWEVPVRLFHRATGAMILNMEFTNRHQNHDKASYRILFHPQEPLVIAADRAGAEANLYIHTLPRDPMLNQR